MGFNNTQRQHGYLPINSSDPDVVFSASCKSASNLPSTATGDATIDGGGAASVTYDSTRGMLLGSTDARLNILPCLSAAVKASMANGFQLTYYVEKGHVDHNIVPTVSARYLLTMRFGSTEYVYVGKTISTGKYFCITTTGGTKSVKLDSDGHPDYARIDVRFDGHSMVVHRDHIPLTQENVVGWLPTDIVEMMYIGGRVTSLYSEESYYIKDIQLTLRPAMFPVSPKVLNLVITGDSLATQAQHSNSSAGYYYSGYSGTDYGASTVLAAITNDDSAAAVMITRELAKAGVFIGGQVNGYGRTSCRATGGSILLSSRTTVMFADTANEYPTPSQGTHITDVICIIGTNDAAGGSDPATFYTDYQTEITAWVANGVQRIGLVNVTGRKDADYESAIDAINLQIAALVAANSECYLIDAFSATEGHNIPLSYLSDSDFLHWKPICQAIVGIAAGKALLKQL